VAQLERRIEAEEEKGRTSVREEKVTKVRQEVVSKWQKREQDSAKAFFFFCVFFFLRALHAFTTQMPYKIPYQRHATHPCVYVFLRYEQHTINIRSPFLLFHALPYFRP
jgi:hypothetical protein